MAAKRRARPPNSVAQHSVAVARLLRGMGEPPAVQYAGLLHDAAEAYAQDLIRPLKLKMGKAYLRIERAWEARISDMFALPDATSEVWSIVSQMDKWILKVERRDITNLPEGWLDLSGVPDLVLDHSVRRMEPDEARDRFMRAYAGLTARREQRTE